MNHLSARQYALLAALALAIYLPGRAALPPLDRDEPRYMQATAQMLQSGNFIDIRFQDHPRYLQPAGIYWLEAAAVAVSGTLKHRQVWGWRIPSLIAAVGSVLLTASIGASLFGAEAGLLGALLLAVSVLMTAEARLATIDSCLLTTVLLVEWALLRVLRDRAAQIPAPRWAAALYWSGLGLGLMLKGPVILIPGFGTPLALALVERDARWFRRLRPAWGVVLMLAVVLPWCIAITLASHGAFFKRAVGTNFLGKIASGQQAHGLPPGYHLVVFWIAFWPGSFFAASAVPFVWRQRHLPEVRFLLCWIIPHWVIFELIATKLPHYVLPTYPAIAILSAAAMAAPGEWQWPRRTLGRALLAFFGIVWVAIGLVIVAAGPVLLWRLQHMVSVAALLAAGIGLVLVPGAALLVVLREPRKAVAFAAAAALVSYASLFWVVLPNLRTIWLSPRIVAMVRAVEPCPDSRVASASFSEPSLVFLLGGKKTDLVNAAGAADLLAHDPSCAVALVGTRDEAEFRARVARDNIAVRPLGRVDGINYSTGKRLALTLYEARKGGER